MTRMMFDPGTHWKGTLERTRPVNTETPTGRPWGAEDAAARIARIASETTMRGVLDAGWMPPRAADALKGELVRLRALVGDETYDADQWGTVSRAEAIAQANEFHAKMVEFRRMHDARVDERDAAREEARQAREAADCATQQAAEDREWRNRYQHAAALATGALEATENHLAEALGGVRGTMPQLIALVAQLRQTASRDAIAANFYAARVRELEAALKDTPAGHVHAD